MQNQKIAKLDVEQVFSEKYPNIKLPKIVMNLLKKIIHADDINALFANAPGKKNLDFIDSCMKQLNFTCHVVGKEHLPPDNGKKLLFISNHPQGGADAICIAHVLGHQYAGKVRFYANEILTVLEPLKEMFLPIYKHRQQNRDSIRHIQEFYETDNHLIVFPAGVTSYKSGEKILDHDWRKNFVKVAVEYQRDVVPMYFAAKNSDTFYRIENFRKRIRSKVNFEVILFAHEFFKQKGNTFTMYIGKPIPWQTFDKTKSHKEWADWMKDLVFGLPDQCR